MSGPESDVEDLTPEQRARAIRAKFEELCNLLNFMHEWDISYSLHIDDICRWHSKVTFKKMVEL